MNKFRKSGVVAIVAASVAMVAGCATPTPYQPLGARGTGASGGYSDQQVTDNRYRVSFVGNTLTSRKTVENYLLYRAAQLTLQRGYDSFTILDRATDRDVETRVSRDPAFAGPYGWWRPSWRYYGAFGWRSWDPWYGDPFWADSIDVQTVNKYEATALIEMRKGTTPNDRATFDARQVVAALGPSIILPKS